MQRFTVGRFRIVGTLGLVLLAACGGGGGGDVVEDVTVGDVADSPDTGSDPVTTPEVVADGRITILSLDASAPALSRESGTLDLDTGAVQFGTAAGALSADRLRVTVTDGVVRFDDPASTASNRYDATLGGETRTGVVGLTPSVDRLPGGTATYSGDAVLTATAGTTLFELTGTADVTARFGAATPTVTTEITGLQGTQQSAVGAPVAVANAGSLTLSGAEISGTGFSGGDAALSSPVLSLSGGARLSLEGAFLGVDADEAGGVFVIDDGATQIFGDFLAE